MDSPVALITGAGRGIGRAAAIALSEAGYELALLSRTQADLHETAKAAGRGLVVPTDVTNPNQIDAAVAKILEMFGRLDAAIHCAGIAPVLGIECTTNENWREIVDTNLSAAFYLCRAVWPQFKKQKSGVVVNISSESSRDPFPGFAAYGAAKAGLNLLGLSAAREGAAHNITVHTIAPAAVETEMFRRIISAKDFPPEKTLAPEEVAQVIVQCATGELRHTSGEVIYLHKTL
jgi:NAD(P)-dependent dehydrogenase (short-subunit alcohol dehydrogenase family)